MHEYGVQLPHGYELIKTNATECVLANPERLIAAGPNVQSYAQKGDYVIGFVRSDASRIPSDFNGLIKDGYFILNTRTGRIFDGLSAKSWNSRLDKMRVKNRKLQRT